MSKMNFVQPFLNNWIKTSAIVGKFTVEFWLLVTVDHLSSALVVFVLDLNSQEKSRLKSFRDKITASLACANSIVASTFLRIQNSKFWISKNIWK